jgi:transcriptional regulator with XRE-family HTH domain
MPYSPFLLEKMVDLKRFGQTLRQLRKGAGLTQAELARRVAVSEQLLSIWERGYQHGERTWQPERASIVRLLALFAQRLTAEEAQIWAGQAGHTLNESELLGIFPQAVLSPPPPPNPYASRQRLDHLPDQRLFGRDGAQAKLEQLLLAEGRPWLIALDGMGGIGKPRWPTLWPRRRYPAGAFTTWPGSAPGRRSSCPRVSCGQ